MATHQENLASTQISKKEISTHNIVSTAHLSLEGSTEALCWHRKHRLNLFQGRFGCLSSSQKKIKEHNGTGLQKWKVRARTLWTTVGITCTERLDRAMLSMNQKQRRLPRLKSERLWVFSTPSYLTNGVCGWACGLICRGRMWCGRIQKGMWESWVTVSQSRHFHLFTLSLI